MSFEVIISLLAALGVGGLLGAFLNRYFEQQKQTNEHDIKVFTQSNEILSEQKLSNIAHFHLLASHSVNRDDLMVLKRWCVFLGRREIAFWIKKCYGKTVSCLPL